jgi:hypothetical protein
MLSQESVSSMAYQAAMHKSFRSIESFKETHALPAYLSTLNANEKRKRNACHAGEERMSKDAQRSKRSCMHA